MASKAHSHNDYTVGLVCALPKEQTAAIAMLDQRHDGLPNPVNDHNAYTLGSMSNHNVVIACLPKGEIGTSSAATVATRMISTFPYIRFGLMVGIGGGVPPNVRLGDVVVSTPADGLPGVIQWDMGKAEQMKNFRQTGVLNNPPSALLTAVTRLESKHEMEGSAIPQYLEDMTTKYPKLALKYTKSDNLEDVCFEADYNHIPTAFDPQPSISNVGKKRDYNGQIIAADQNSCRGCDRRRALKRPPREMTVHYGLIASGNQVIKDPVFRDQINARLGGGVLCFEMEAAGLMNGFPCAVIRGICDYCDSHKNNVWQEHAAAVAAAFAKELLSVIPPAQVVDAPTAGKVMQSVAETVNSIKDDVSVIQSDVHTIRSAGDEEYRKTLRSWLSPIDYDKVQSDVHRNCQEGTGQWFLNDARFTNWLSGTSSQTLFCPGIPGAGKTVIASLVVNHLRSRYLDNSTSETDRVGVAVLYCNYQQQNDQASHDLLASLLSQLSLEQDIVPAGIRTLHDQFRKRRTQPSSRDIFEELRSSVTGYSTAFVVIDALDECKDDATRKDLLNKMLQLQEIADVRLMLTSRPNILPNREDMVQLPIHASEEDVRRYLTSQLGHLSEVVERDAVLQSEIELRVSKASDGMFLLAQLYIGSLKDKHTKKAITIELNKMDTGHAGLDQAYKGAFQRIESSLSKSLLSWVVIAQRLLTVDEMQHALAIEPGTSNLDLSNICDIQEVVSGCAGLVVLDSVSQIIRLVHQTAKDYFKANISEYFPGARNNIALNCLTYLSYEELKSGACPNNQLLDMRLKRFPFLFYASRFWVYHWDCMENKVEEPVLSLLLDQGLVSAAGQGALVLTNWGSEYKQRTLNRVTGMHLAAALDLYEFVPRLSEKLSLNSTDNYGFTPLHYATKNEYTRTVQSLLDGGADINLAGNSGTTPLHLASMKGHEAIVTLLIEKGADISCRDNGGGTPLTWAIDTESDAVAELLLKKGAQMEFLYCPFFQYTAPLPSQVVVESSSAKKYDFPQRFRALSTFISFSVYSNTADEEPGQEISPCRYERRIFLPPQFLSRMDFHDHPLLPDGRQSLLYDYYRYRPPVNSNFYFPKYEWSVDDLFFTPLLRAVWIGNHRIVQLLLNMGCSPCFGNSRGVMPLELAKRLEDNTSTRIIMSFWNQPEQFQAEQWGLTKLP